MSLVIRLGIAPFLVFGLAACGESVGEPITGQPDGLSESDTGPGGEQQDSCTAPVPALACRQTQDCANYPDTTCEQGFCLCPSSDAGAPTDDADSEQSCTLPQPELACRQTQDCANYPDTVCGQAGVCVCP